MQVIPGADATAAHEKSTLPANLFREVTVIVAFSEPPGAEILMLPGLSAILK